MLKNLELLNVVSSVTRLKANLRASFIVIIWGSGVQACIDYKLLVVIGHFVECIDRLKSRGSWCGVIEKRKTSSDWRVMILEFDITLNILPHYVV